jgi:hypothetical protein
MLSALIISPHVLGIERAIAHLKNFEKMKFLCEKLVSGHHVRTRCRCTLRMRGPPMGAASCEHVRAIYILTLMCTGASRKARRKQRFIL